MTDRELWVKTMKMVSAMVGGTVVFLGSISLVLIVAGGGHATPSSEARSGPNGPTMSNETRGSESTPPARAPRHGLKGESRPESRPGESI
jgi:hypothetical protein